MKARAWRLRGGGLDDLVAQIVAGWDCGWAMVGRPDRFALAPRGDADLASLDGSLDGRIFTPDAELRWRIDAGTASVVLLAHDLQGAPASDGDDLDVVAGPRSCHLLWGRWSGSAWLEGRIPRPLAYRIPWVLEVGDELAVEVEVLTDSGSPAFQRYVQVKRSADA